MKRIVVGASGASGMPLLVKLLEELKKSKQYEVHLVMSKGAKMTYAQECPQSLDYLKQLVHQVHDNENIGASIASGTFQTEGMIVLPCSMKTVAGIASGYSDNLLLRACDVTIKEKRKLILIARETPLSPIHLKNLHYLSNIHNIMIMPPMMTYYNEPLSIEDMEYHLVGKILSQFDVEIDKFKRWK